MDHATSEQTEVPGIEERLASVIRYHQETKHHFFRYARSLGYLDWANQPDPFRRYEDAPLFALPLLSEDEEPESPPYLDIYEAGSVPPQPVSVQSLSRFLEFALALSAWKRVGDVQWSLRSNPSSGNLHPTEGYVLIGSLDGLAPGPALYHYAPKEHALELRTECPSGAFARLADPFPRHAFFFGANGLTDHEKTRSRIGDGS